MTVRMRLRTSRRAMIGCAAALLLLEASSAFAKTRPSPHQRAGKRGPCGVRHRRSPDFQELSHMSISTISHQARRPLQYTGTIPTATRDHLRAVPTRRATAFIHPPKTVAEDLGVPTLHRTVVDYANFDHAASTPALESVKVAVDIALRTYSSVHRGNGYASRITSGWYEEARTQVHDFVGAREDTW